MYGILNPMSNLIVSKKNYKAHNMQAHGIELNQMDR